MVQSFDKDLRVVDVAVHRGGLSSRRPAAGLSGSAFGLSLSQPRGHHAQLLL